MRSSKPENKSGNPLDSYTKEILSKALGNDHFNLGVDLGCGWGEYGRILKPHVGFLVGVDRNPARLKSALANGYDRAVVGDISSFQVLNADVTFLFYSVEHIPPKEGVKLLSRLRMQDVFLTTDTKFAFYPGDHHSLWSEEVLRGMGFQTFTYSRGLIDLYFGPSIFARRARNF